MSAPVDANRCRSDNSAVHHMGSEPALIQYKRRKRSSTNAACESFARELLF
ncbi:hypothetical protein ACVWWJ_002286 [Luteibacter sp. HA06]